MPSPRVGHPGHAGTVRPLRILAGHLASGTGGNPELRMLYSSIADAGPVEIEPFSTAALFRERWDVIHVYWPEWLIKRTGGLASTALDCVRLLCLLQLARRRGAKVVWTANNIRPHEVDRLGVLNAFVAVFSRIVDQVICPSQTALDQFLFEYPAISGIDARAIPTGTFHEVYRDDRPTMQEAREVLGLPLESRVILMFGHVRPYKNIAQLIRYYRTVAERRDDTFLLIAGKPLDDDHAAAIHAECAKLKNVRADLRFIADDEVQYYLRASNCVVIGTSYAVNTASALLGLTFDRPVMMPHRGAAIEMLDSAGAEWVHTYEGGLRSSVLERALAVKQPGGSPAISDHYDWRRSGSAHFEAFAAIAGRDF